MLIEVALFWEKVHSARRSGAMSGEVALCHEKWGFVRKSDAVSVEEMLCQEKWRYVEFCCSMSGEVQYVGRSGAMSGEVALCRE